MSLPTYDELNSVLVPLAAKAGRLILEFYNTDLQVDKKNDDSPVTLADQAAEKLIIDELQRVWPEITIVAEEMCAAGHIPESSDLFFLVDPLDGTKEFINQRDEFTVNIALIVNGSPYYGIVLAPALGEVFISLDTDRAGYAKLNFSLTNAPSSDFGFVADDFETIAVRDWPLTGPVGVVSRSHPDDKTAEFLNKNNVQERIASGSSLKFCQIARGAADIYPRFGPTMEWDTAAGHAVLSSAGGLLINEKKENFQYGKYNTRYLNGEFIACSKEKIEEIML